MSIVADTHVHVYPAYDPDRLWSAAARKLRASGSDGRSNHRVLCLTETGRDRTWSDVFHHGSTSGSSWRFTPASEAGAGRLSHPEEGDLWVIAGRQLVTRENIEVLALAFSGSLSDGLPADETIAAILREGAVPVLSWSPGKWLGARGRVVSDVLRRLPPDSLLLGDIPLRPRYTPEPAPFRLARRLGFRIAAGADPLPFPGDETQVGRLAVCMAAPFDEQRPVSSIRAALRDPAVRLEITGRRNGWFQAARRMLRHQIEGRKRGAPTPDSRGTSRPGIER